MSPGLPGGLRGVASRARAVMGGGTPSGTPTTSGASPCSPCSSFFPTMPRHNYHKVAPLVKALCAKHGLSYDVKPFLTALADIVG